MRMAEFLQAAGSLLLMPHGTAVPTGLAIKTPSLMRFSKRRGKYHLIVITTLQVQYLSTFCVETCFIY